MRRAIGRGLLALQRRVSPEQLGRKEAQGKHVLFIIPVLVICLLPVIITWLNPTKGREQGNPLFIPHGSMF